MVSCSFIFPLAHGDSVFKGNDLWCFFLLFLAFWFVGGRVFAREDQYCGGVEVVNSVVGL